jgi:hypothetical protein
MIIHIMLMKIHTLMCWKGKEQKWPSSLSCNSSTYGQKDGQIHPKLNFIEVFILNINQINITNNNKIKRFYFKSECNNILANGRNHSYHSFFESYFKKLKWTKCSQLHFGMKHFLYNLYSHWFWCAIYNSHGMGTHTLKCVPEAPGAIKV